MAEHTGIAWTDHTFNPWWGCTKISPGCLHCYAEREAHRFGFDVWGVRHERRYFTQAHWSDPFRWARKAARDGVRRRVFVGSMGDVMDPDVPQMHRNQLWEVIKATPRLDWLVLTKRPMNFHVFLPAWWGQGLPNVRLMTSVESQEYVDRVRVLVSTPSVGGYGVSLEPLLGAVDLTAYTAGIADLWVITGGESGPGFRPLERDWVRALRDVCQAHGYPFFFKQDAGVKPEHLPLLDGKRWAEVPGCAR